MVEPFITTFERDKLPLIMKKLVMPSQDIVYNNLEMKVYLHREDFDKCIKKYGNPSFQIDIR